MEGWAAKEASGWGRCSVSRMGLGFCVLCPPVKTHHFRQTHILYVNCISLKLIFNAVFRDKMRESNVEDSWILQVEVSTHETENKSS